MAISNTHARIVAACATGEWADLRGLPEAQREVEASFIRAMMLGLHHAGSVHKEIAARFVSYSPLAAEAPGGGAFFVAPPGVRILGAHVKGRLDLSDCVGDGGQGLPRLALEGCCFDDNSDGPSINIDGAHLVGLSLEGSRFVALSARHCIIEGGVNLQGVGPTGGWRPQTFEIDTPEWLVKLRVDIGVPPAAAETAGPPAEDKREERLPLGAPWPEDAASFCSVDFESARVGGVFDLRMSRMRGGPSNWYALDVGRAHLGGALYLSDAEVEGGVYLGYARIDGALSAERTRLIAGIRNIALSAESLHVEGAVLLRKGFVARGTVSIGGARFNDILEMTDFKCHGLNGSAISSDGLIVDNTWKLLRDFYCLGKVQANGVRVSGNLELGRGLYVNGNGGYSMSFEALHVENDFLSVPDIFVKGQVRLLGAKIDGELDFSGWVIEAAGAPPQAEVQPEPQAVKQSYALLADSMMVGSRFLFHVNTIKGVISFRDVSCQTFRDLTSGYRSAEYVAMDGFNYGRLEVMDGCWRQRAHWLSWMFSPVKLETREWRVRPPLPKKLDDYHPQPYLHLARRLSIQGHEADARKILSLRRTIERKVVSRRWARPLLWLFWAMFDYGLSATRALLTMIVTLSLGATLVWFANHRGALVVDAQSVAVVGQSSAATDLPKAVACGDQINPPIYAIDLFIPLIDLRQEGKCEVGEAPGARLGPGVAIPIPGLNWTWRSAFAEVELWRWGKALYGICGWILTSLAILTFSGVLRRQAEQA